MTGTSSEGAAGNGQNPVRTTGGSGHALPTRDGWAFRPSPFNIVIAGRAAGRSPHHRATQGTRDDNGGNCARPEHGALCRLVRAAHRRRGAASARGCGAFGQPLQELPAFWKLLPPTATLRHRLPGGDSAVVGHRLCSLHQGAQTVSWRAAGESAGWTLSAWIPSANARLPQQYPRA